MTLGPDVAEGIAGGIARLGLYYIIGILAVAVGALFWKLLSDRDSFQAKLEALSLRLMDTVLKNSESNILLTRAVDELRHQKRRAPESPREAVK